MNFLLHRHFATDELDSNVAGMGSMLPDLWRMADRRMRARRLGPFAEPSPEAPSSCGHHAHTRALQAGVTHHLEADTWFHQTEVFVGGERMLSQQFATVGAPKLVLLAHPAWEMCLDGALLLKGDFDETLQSLRADLRTARCGFEIVADLHGATTLPDRTQFSERMDRFCRGLTDGRWIGSYRSGDGLADCVGRIREQFGLPSWSEAQEALAALMLEQALERAREALSQLVRARRRHIRDATR